MEKYKLIKKMWMLTLFIIILPSCVVSIPLPESADDTLLVILTEKQLAAGMNSIYTYYEVTTDKLDTPIIVTPKKPYCLISNLPPGKYSNFTAIQQEYTNYGVELRTSNRPTPIRT